MQKIAQRIKSSYEATIPNGQPAGRPIKNTLAFGLGFFYDQELLDFYGVIPGYDGSELSTPTGANMLLQPVITPEGKVGFARFPKTIEFAVAVAPV